MNKKVLSLVAIIALVAILTVCLVACNADSYAKKLEKAGYTVEVLSEDDIDEEFGEDTEIEWAVYAAKISLKDGAMGYVIKFADADDAKEAAADAEKAGMEVKISGKIVIAGTDGFVDDAK